MPNSQKKEVSLSKRKFKPKRKGRERRGRRNQSCRLQLLWQRRSKKNSRSSKLSNSVCELSSSNNNRGCVSRSKRGKEGRKRRKSRGLSR